MSWFRRRRIPVLIAFAAMSAMPVAAHAEYDAPIAPSLSRGEAREAAEDALLERAGDTAEIRSIRCFRIRRTAVRCEARGTLDASSPTDGQLRWKGKVLVTAQIDDLGDDVVTAVIKHFEVGVVLTRHRAAAVAATKLEASIEDEVTVDETYCRMLSNREAMCVLNGSMVDTESGQEEEYEAKVRVRAAASADGTVRVGARIVHFYSWPVYDDAGSFEVDEDGYGGWGAPPRYPTY